MNKFKSIYTLLAISVIGFTSCSEDVETPAQQDFGYTLAFTAQGSANESTDYLLTTESLMEGEISAVATGIEQTGWRYMAHQNNTVFSIGYYDDNNAIGYGLDENGNVVEKGRFVFQNTLDMVGRGDDNTMLAMEVPRIGFADRIFHVVDVNNIGLRSTVSTPIWENRADSLVAWPTALMVRDDKLFVPFYPLHARGDFTTPSTDTAYVAVYSYPDLSFEKYIKDTRTGPLGVYGCFNGMIQAENGDLYTYSSSSLACGFTQQTKPSGLLRIRDGETEFDDSYFFDFEAATGGKINFIEYTGNGKLLANVVVDDSGLWGAYVTGNEISKLMVLDLEAQTATDVANVPLHGGFYGDPWMVEDGKVYMSINTAQDSYIYEIDPSTATGTRGAKVLGKELKGIYNLTN